jgi:hypothetical protein
MNVDRSRTAHPRLRAEQAATAPPRADAAARPPNPNLRPPASARTYYKVVACDDATNGQFVSIFDGRTKYALDVTTSPVGGAWVCPDLLAVVQHAGTLPSRSARLNSPRVILQCLGWNDRGNVPRASPAHASSSTKLLVSHVRPVAVLPYTAAGQPGTPAGLEDFLTDDIAMLSSSERPSTAPPPSRPAELLMRQGEATRTFGGGLQRAQRLQAATAALHEDVLNAQARLRRVRDIGNVGASTTDDESSAAPAPAPREWMRRALARMNPAQAPPPLPAPRPFAVPA